MSTRLGIRLFVVAIGALLATQLVSLLMARQDVDGGKAPSPASKSEESDLNLRYAQAQLGLMETRLAELEERNRRAANTIRPAAIQLVQEYVAQARQRLESAKSDAANDSQIQVARAEAGLRAAEQDLKRAEAVNKRLANSVGPAEIKRLTAQRDLARVRVEKARHLASESPISNVRFELDQLREHVQDLLLSEAMSRRGS
jgi:hypothetical protein